MADAKRDQNFVTTLLAVSSVDGVTPVVVYANPTTHRLLTDNAGGGSGDVVGPGASTQDALVRWDNTAGTLVADSIVQLTDAGVLSPVTSDTATLGSGLLMWSDLFLASGAVINFNNGASTITHGANVLTIGGSGATTLALGTNSLTLTGSIGATGARVTKGWFTDLEVTNAIAGSITGNAATVTTNANLSGAVTSVGNTTTMNSALDSLTDVTIATPAVDQFLKYNGSEWVNGTGPSASVGPGVDFFLATPSIIAGGADNAIPLLTLSKSPVVTAEQTISGTGDGASTPIPFSAWLYDTALGITSIPSGVWQFETWCAVDVAVASVTTLTRNVYAVLDEAGGVTVTVTGTGTSRTATASGGTPFATSKIDTGGTALTDSYLKTAKGLYRITARTNDTVVTITTPAGYTNDSGSAFSVWKRVVGGTTPDINTTGTNYTLMSIDAAAAAYTVTALHKLGSISFVTSDSSRTVTVTYNGTARNSHFTSTLTTNHNDLPGLQGGAVNEYYHLTSAEYTGLSGLTASEIVVSNASGDLASAAVATYPSLTELTYVKGVTSAIQTQLNAKAPLASPTFTGTVTLPKTTEIQDTSADHQYVLAVSELTADRTITLPLLTGTDTFAFEAHTQTLTNKRINPRIVSAASYTTDTGSSLSIATCDEFVVTAQAGALKFNNPGGTPVEGNKLIIRVKDDGTGRALTYDTQFRAVGVTLPTTTVANKTTYIGFIYNSTDTKWDGVAVANEA